MNSQNGDNLKKLVTGNVLMDEYIQKSDSERISQERSFAFTKRKRLSFSIEKGLSKPGLVSYDVLRRIVRSVHAARICVNVLKDKVAKTKWVIQPINPREKVDPERIKQVENLFKYPNPSESFRTLLDKIMEDLLSLDTVFIEKVRYNDGTLAGLFYCDAATIRPVFNERGEQDVIVPLPDKDGGVKKLPVSYVQIENASPYGGATSGSVLAAWPKKDMIHFNMHPQGNMENFGYGLSPIESVLGVITNILNADNYNSTYFQEGAFPPAIIQLKANIDPRELENLREYLYSELNGQFHRPAVFAGDMDMDVKDLKTLTQRDMQFMDYMTFMLKLLAAAFGLSGQDVGLSGDINSTDSNVQKDLSQAKGYGALLTLLQEEFNQQIIWKDFGYTDIEFAWINPDTEDPRENVAVYDTSLRNGSLTLNEVRKSLGKEPYGAWADIPMVLGAMGYTPIMPKSDAAKPEGEDEEETRSDSDYVGMEKPMKEQAIEDDSNLEKTVTEEIHKSILTPDGYETYVDDRGYGQPFIFYKILTGEGYVIKPPVAVNLDSQIMEEKLTHKLADEGLRVNPVTRMTLADIETKLLTSDTLRKQFNDYIEMAPAYDSKKWSATFGNSRKYPYYSVSKFIDGRSLKDPLLIKDMQRVPQDYKQAIKELADLWLAEKKYVLGDRRADQVLFTPDKHIMAFDFQFEGNKNRWKSTKDSYANALKPIPELYNLFMELTNQNKESVVQKIKNIFKKDALESPADEYFAFGTLVNGDDKFKENVKKIFDKKSEDILIDNGFTKLSFVYDFNTAQKILSDYVTKNPKAYGGIFMKEDERGLMYCIYTKQ